MASIQRRNSKIQLHQSIDKGFLTTRYSWIFQFLWIANVLTSRHNKQRATPSRFFKIKAETTGTKKKGYTKIASFFGLVAGWKAMECNGWKKDGGFDESEMKSSKHRDKEGGIREVSSVHNVTRDHEKKVEPAAESRLWLCGCEAAEGGTCEGCKNCCCWPVWKSTFGGKKKIEVAVVPLPECDCWWWYRGHDHCRRCYY